MDKTKLCTLAGAAVAALAVSACGMDNRYYVKTDGSPDVLGGVMHLGAPTTLPATLNVGVTFKSDGKVSPKAGDTLYQSVSEGLRAKGQWDVHRLGRPGDDFAPVIAAVIQSRPVTALSNHSAADAMQRLLVLVENAPDLSAGTEVNYFLSGMTFGLHSLHKPTDRYDVTIAYRDAAGMNHVYRSHQDLLYSTNSKLFGSEDRSLVGLKHFDTSLAAFNTIVNNSVNGAQKRTITVGKPQLNASAAPVAPVRAMQTVAAAPPVKTTRTVAAARPVKATQAVAAAQPVKVAQSIALAKP